MNIKDKTRIMHIIEAIDEIALYVSEKNRDRKTELAITRLIEIIGEASNHLSEELKAEHAYIPWRQIVNMRHIIVHEYFGVDSNALWKVAKDNIPDLGQKLKNIIKTKE